MNPTSGSFTISSRLQVGICFCPTARTFFLMYALSILASLLRVRAQFPGEGIREDDLQQHLDAALENQQVRTCRAKSGVELGGNGARSASENHAELLADRDQVSLRLQLA